MPLDDLAKENSELQSELDKCRVGFGVFAEKQLLDLIKDRLNLRAEVRGLREKLAAARKREMKTWYESPAFQTFVELKHGRVWQILVMLQDGQISRGRACEALAELAHGTAPYDVRLPECAAPQVILEDETPGETISNLRAANALLVKIVEEKRKWICHLRSRLRGC